MNLLPVTDVDVINSTCKLSGQKVSFDHSAERMVTENPRLAIRPEELQLGAGEERNSLNGLVTSVMFLGAVVRLRVKVGDVTLSTDLFNERNMTLPRTGDEILVSFPVHSCWLM